MIFTFSLTVSEATAAVHSGSSLVTSLSNNPPSIRITCGVTCTILSNNERLFMFMRGSSCWTRFERSNRSKGTASLLDRIFISAAFSTGNSGCPRIGCPYFSNHLVKYLLYFCLIGLLLLQSFIELSFLTEAVSILVFITHPVLDYHMVAIQSYYPSTNITLMHRVGLQPG